MKVLCIIPAYNEQESILKTCKKIQEYKYDYIVINDGSNDGTENILINNNIPHIRLIQNLGIGGAVQTGYIYAKDNNYDIAIQLDGDGQHDPKYIEELIEPLKNNEADMVIGSRFINKKNNGFKSTASRRIGIKIISLFIKLVTKTRIYDTTSGMRAINKKLINEFALEYPVEYPEPVSTTIVLRKGYNVTEKSVNMIERKAGTSSIKAWKNIYYMINVCLSIMLIGLRRNKK